MAVARKRRLLLVTVVSGWVRVGPKRAHGHSYSARESWVSLFGLKIETRALTPHKSLRVIRKPPLTTRVFRWFKSRPYLRHLVATAANSVAIWFTALCLWLFDELTRSS